MDAPLNLLYFYDALCGWCYGFSPVLQQFHRDHEGEVAVEPVSGGMILAEREGPIGEVAPYIRQAYRIVEERTGVRFGQGFLEGILAPGKAIFSSWLPAVALSILKAEKAEEAVPFAHALQQAIYHDGISPADPEAYGPIGARFGWEAADFTDRLQRPAYQEAARADFVRTREWGIGGFPTLILQQGEGKVLLAQGYVPLDELKRRFAHARHRLAGTDA